MNTEPIKCIKYKFMIDKDVDQFVLQNFDVQFIFV